MIDFSYKKEGNGFFNITLKTDRTEAGTFHRMSAVIYSLGWDIISGTLDTVNEGGVSYTLDTLRLKTFEPNDTQKAIEIGMLLDFIFSKEDGLEEIYKNAKPVKSQIKHFFREKAELLFQDEPKNNWTCFYMEADSGRGLLFRMTRVLKEYGVNILKGHIETDPITERAKDTFYLQDKEGKMFGEKPIAEEVRAKILAQL